MTLTDAQEQEITKQHITFAAQYIEEQDSHVRSLMRWLSPLTEEWGAVSRKITIQGQGRALYDWMRDNEGKVFANGATIIKANAECMYIYKSRAGAIRIQTGKYIGRPYEVTYDALCTLVTEAMAEQGLVDLSWWD